MHSEHISKTAIILYKYTVYRGLGARGGVSGILGEYEFFISK